MDEGETISFKVLCESGSLPIEYIMTLTSFPIKYYTDVKACGDNFSWKIPYDFVNESESGGVKSVNLNFVGATKFKIRDTAQVKLIVRNALNYPMAVEEYKQMVKIQKLCIVIEVHFSAIRQAVKENKIGTNHF
jgi:hypothetical protein